jgi:hypothetical protein
LRFVEAKSDTSLFISRRGADTVYLLLYVDDIVITASSIALLEHTISTLQQEFTINDLGSLHNVLGVSVQHQANGLFLTQRQFALNILEHVAMLDCKPISTHVDLQSKVFATFRPSVTNPTQFRSLDRALQYLTFTRPDITYTAQQICLHMHDPWESHLAA